MASETEEMVGYYWQLAVIYSTALHFSVQENASSHINSLPPCPLHPHHHQIKKNSIAV